MKSRVAVSLFLHPNLITVMIQISKFNQLNLGETDAFDRERKWSQLVSGETLMEKARYFWEMSGWNICKMGKMSVINVTLPATLPLWNHTENWNYCLWDKAIFYLNMLWPLLIMQFCSAMFVLSCRQGFMRRHFAFISTILNQIGFKSMFMLFYYWDTYSELISKILKTVYEKKFIL